MFSARIKRVNSDRFSNALAGDWNFAENYDFVEGGRLWIFLEEAFVVTVLRCCDQVITIIGVVDGHRTTITAIYGSNNGVVRRDLWDHLSGYFNIIAKPEESSDFDVMRVHYTPDIKDFQECLEGLDLIDHPFLGPLFTWSNKQDGSYLARKLDRILVNDQWLLDFPDSFVDYKAHGIQTFNLAHTAQRRTDEERRVHSELVDLETAEAVFYKQKAKAHWLSEGDLNTKCFHQKFQANKKRNNIRVIKSEDGQLFESFKDMVVELVGFFTNLIGSTDPLVKGCSAGNLKDLINVCLPDSAYVCLTKEVSDVEIKEALFRQGKDKSLGPDGYTDGFSKAAWSTVGSDFTSDVRYFFQTSYLMSAFNFTTLVLVPKFPNATLAKEFRPISCFSVAYKTITRILVDRLTPYFPGLISHNQSTFLKGRNIVDNIVLAQEIVKGYSRKNLSPRCTIKIDIQKAFDSVNWNFLLFVLGEMGLSDIFYNWIKACITTPMYYVCLNGSVVGYFKGSRGLGKGILYPLIFLLL
ncbi:uncharacterized protein LOC120117831 [Hibiscus syriacus]|uniref:uncharacterized protein LOC120117831 n=1 Tax=Hibiscus syriacus TaxID=106335 RepID=UPI0019221C6F|nr:uncharacterized protein LOC120117831 [Hibiscus syriacus]